MRYSQTSQRVENEKNRAFANQWVSGMEAYYQREEKKKDLSDNHEFLSKQIETLNKFVRQMDEMSKKIGGE